MRELFPYIDKKGYSYLGIIIYLVLIVFSPYLNIGGRENFEITFIITLTFVIFIPGCIRRFRERENSIINTILLLMCIVCIADSISILNFVRVSGSLTGITANIIPNLKVALYILLISGIYNLELGELNYKSFINLVIPVLACLSALIGLFQRFNFLNFNNWFTRYYISSESGKVLIEVLKDNQQWSRVLGTLSNPNFYSVQLVIFIVFVVTNIMYITNIKLKIFNYITAALLFAALIFTQSRTALVVIFCLCLYLILLQIIKYGKRNILKYFIYFVVMVVASLLTIKFLGLNYLFDALKNGMGTSSIVQRIDRWNDAIQLFKLHPLIGIGPVIGTYFPAVDNEYIQILRNYGVLGLTAHLSLYLYVFIKTIRDILKSSNVLIQQYALAVNCSIIAVLIFNMTLATFYHWRNFVFILIVCCLWAKLRADSKIS